jgi:peptidoglycan/LPS O-acetylase OafA/YrhL
MGIAYHREIDGLRALAVGAVVLYHAGLGRAGYVGVDVFFVISGYLITALLIREKSGSGRIDLADFYARRVRRIFPAAVAVITFVLLAALIFPPSMRVPIEQSATAASLFGANVYFHLVTAGYFVGDASQLPLLHLWSLSVEEQFYLLWPALLILGAGRRTFGVIAVASLVLCEWLLIGHPSAAFYEMPARAWELAAGALVASSPPRALPRWTPWAGAALTALACVIPLPHFPGLGALPAVAGAGLVLAAIHGGATNSLLASRPFVGLGLISYSLYLWHWPLLAFDRLMRAGPAPLETRLGLVALAVLLAIGSHRYIETPFRRARLPSRRTVGAGLAAMLATGCAAWAWQTPPAKGTREVGSEFDRECFPYISGQRVRAQRPACSGTERKIVVIGDSFAHSWEPLAEEVGRQSGLPVVTFARDACPPMLGVQLPLPRMRQISCDAWNATTVEWLRGNRADTVLVFGRWERYAQPGLGADQGLHRMIDAILPFVQRVLILVPTPVLPETPEKCASLRLDCAVSKAAFDRANGLAWQAVRAVEGPHVGLLDPTGWVCEGDTCKPFRGALPLYQGDGAHISAEAALAYAAKVDWRKRLADRHIQRVAPTQR